MPNWQGDHNLELNSPACNDDDECYLSFKYCYV